MASRKIQPKSSEPPLFPGRLPAPEGAPAATLPNLQVSLLNVPQIWAAFASDLLQKTPMGGIPDRIAQSGVVLTSLRNGSFISQIVLRDDWVFELSDRNRDSLRRAIQPILDRFMGAGARVAIEGHELLVHRPDNTFERLASLPRIEAASEEKRRGRAVSLGPLVLMPFPGSEDPEQREVFPTLTVFPRETKITSEPELLRALNLFTDLLRCYLSIAEVELRRNVPRENLTIDGAMIPPAAEAQTPKGFLQMQSEMSRKDLEKLLRPADIAAVRFADVLGQVEAVQAMKNISRQIHARARMAEWGATLPTGILLVGPPGNGGKWENHARGSRSK